MTQFDWGYWIGGLANGCLILSAWILFELIRKFEETDAE